MLVEMNWDEIDSLIDAGFPATTELDIENPTYERSQYFVSNRNGIDFTIANRICDYPEDVRNNAANDLVSALLDSCENHEQRIELSVNLLGYDPR